MDKELSRICDLDTPKLNPVLAEGLAVKQMKDVERYVDQMFKAAARGFPKDLVYVSGVACTPEKEFEELIKKKAKRTMDVARSDLYLMKYQFRYQGVDMPPRYISLPFVGEAGSIVLSGSRFFISPVLSDPVISITSKNIFVRLLRDKLTFERQAQQFNVDGPHGPTRETVQMAWSGIYHTSAKTKPAGSKINAKCSLVHYLLCKYGFTETMSRFGKCHPVLGGPEINTVSYPPEHWVIVSSCSIAEPKGRRMGGYVPSTLRVAIPKNQYTQNVRNLLGGFFYVVDLFPEHVGVEWVNNLRMWRTLMGYILFSEHLGIGKLISNIESHIDSLDQYLDEMIVRRLRETDIHVDDIYQLFAVIIDCFNEWITGATNEVASMYNKELSILPFLLEQIKQGIFNFYFRIKAASKKEDAPPLKADQINGMMNATLRVGMIHGIRSGHGEVTTVSYSGDNKAFKITSMLVPQEASSGVKSRNDRAVMTDPSKRLHASIAEVGGYSALPKSAPDGRSRLNLHLEFDDKGVVMANPELRGILAEAQEKFNR